MPSHYSSPIGVFDSGFGGLTVLRELVRTLPDYDYLYLGDNARTPYGTRSFETVYRFTLECVEYLFEQGCELVILACNTASAKALRTIQQHDLPLLAPQRRVLGVIRPQRRSGRTHHPHRPRGRAGHQRHRQIGFIRPGTGQALPARAGMAGGLPDVGAAGGKRRV